MKNSVLLFIILLFSCTSENGSISSKKVDINKYYIKSLKYRDFSTQQLGKVDLSKLKEIDTIDYMSVKQKEFNSAKYYYFSIKDTSKIHSLVYYYFNEGKQVAFNLVNYSAKGEYIGDIIISSISGDGGYFSNSEGKFVNDSVIIREDKEGYYEWVVNPDSHSDKEVIESYNKLQILLKKNGRVKVDTLSTRKNF